MNWKPTNEQEILAIQNDRLIDTNDYGLYEDDAEKTLERRHQNLNQKRALCEKRSKKDKRTVERIKRDLVYCIYSLMTDGQTDSRKIE